MDNKTYTYNLSENYDNLKEEILSQISSLVT